MKFKLSLFPPSIEFETQAIEQVSTIDLVTAILGVIQNESMPMLCVHEEEVDGSD